MSQITFIDGTRHAKCQMCGNEDELRPYGPGGKFVCFDCAMKDEEEAKRQFEALANRGLLVIK